MDENKKPSYRYSATRLSAMVSDTEWFLTPFWIRGFASSAYAEFAFFEPNYLSLQAYLRIEAHVNGENLK